MHQLSTKTTKLAPRLIHIDFRGCSSCKVQPLACRSMAQDSCAFTIFESIAQGSSTTLAISTLASMMPGPGWLEQSKVELRVGSVGALLCGTRRWCKRSSTQRSIRMGAGMVNRTVCWCCHHNSGRRNGCWMRIHHQGIWTWAVREAVHWVVLQDMWRPTSI